MRTPTNIRADGYSPHANRLVVGWVIDGMRYHVWLDLVTMKVERAYGRMMHVDGTIYKNAPLALNRGDPGHFNTIYLDASAKANAPILAHVLAVVERDGLIQKAIDAYNAEENAKLAEWKAARKLQQIEDAGPELLDALQKLVGLMESGMLVNHPQLCPERRDEHARAFETAAELVRKLEGEPQS